MFLTKKPYLIIPKLIEQPTWGGTYILQLKDWTNNFFQNKKIGQSYELFSGSKLTLKISNSADASFLPEFGFADKNDTIKEGFSYTYQEDYCNLTDLIQENAEQVLGKKILQKYGKMPLLIKINQASGNSFQLHIKPGLNHPRWKPKAESWYYLEDGLVTCAVKKSADLASYKAICHEINNEMRRLSQKVVAKETSLDEAQKSAKTFISQKNPWQFVNLHEMKKHSLLDLSLGGLHHSWEGNKEEYPLGNVLYEIQQDVMDPVCTIRAFDQGKFKTDGTIREIHIDDYFDFLDTDTDHNRIQNLTRVKQGTKLLSTVNYSLDILEVDDILTDHTGDSFCHLYVREGTVAISTTDGEVQLTQGHSCFIPHYADTYHIKTNGQKSVLLKAFIEV